MSFLTTTCQYGQDTHFPGEKSEAQRGGKLAESEGAGTGSETQIRIDWLPMSGLLSQVSASNTNT